MNVCFVSHSAERGGAELALLDTVVACHQRGIACRVLLPAQGPLTADLDNKHLPHEIIPYTGWLAHRKPGAKRMALLLREVLRSLRVARQVRRWHVDVVYTNTLVPFVGALAAKVTGRKHVWHIHEFGFEDHGLFFFVGERRALSWASRCTDLFIANSKAIAAKFSPLIRDTPLQTLYYGIALPERQVEPRSEASAHHLRCAIIGSIHEGKRQEDAIRAVGLLAEQGKYVELVIAGGTRSPGYEAHLKELVRRLGIADRTRFAGHTDDVYALLAQVDLLLVCSRSEAFGRVTVEGMLAGKPVVGSRSGGTPEIISPGETGFLYSPGHHGQLAEHIEYFMEHPEALSRMGENGSRIARQRFSLERYGERIVQLIASVM